MIHGKGPGLHEDTIDLTPLEPLVDAYIQLLSKEERDKLFEEAKEGVDSELLKIIEDDKQLLLPYISSYIPDIKDKAYVQSAIDGAIRYVQDNKEEIKEEIGGYSSGLEAFKHIIHDAIMDGYFTVIGEQLGEISKDIKEIKRNFDEIKSLEGDINGTRNRRY
jgi:hypothetical protein